MRMFKQFFFISMARMVINFRRIPYEVLFTVDLKREYVGQNQ
jgi:hypothetical protein